jgi:Xaa-Pro aminopeptidase
MNKDISDSVEAREIRFRDRRRLLRKRLGDGNVDSLLVVDLANVRYLTGFTGSAACLLISQQREILISDARYQQQINEECAPVDAQRPSEHLEIVMRDVAATLTDATVETIQAAGLNSLGFEAHRMVKATYDEFKTRLAAVELVATQGMVERLRSIKDDFELSAIRRSIDVNQEAFLNTVANMAAGQTEREFAFALENEMRVLGASGFAFDPIVGVGPRAALPHGKPGKSKIGSGGCLLVDWGANVDGYLSDLTRVVVCDQPDEKFIEIYNVVLAAQLAAISSIGPGVSCKSVDHAARSVIEDAGYGDYFGHGTGHNFGLEIHEKPYFSQSDDELLAAGMVVTVEPGIYIPGYAGVRIEDDVLVTENGQEVLSNLPKDWEQCVVRLGDS